MTTATRSDTLWNHVHLLSVIAQTGSFTQAAQLAKRTDQLGRALGC